MARLTRIGMALALALAGGCGGGPPVASAADAARAGRALAELSEGRTVLVRSCGGCHRPPMPGEHRAGEWPQMLDEMAGRAHLEPIARQRLEAYLIALAPR